jgi:hypothetical protein
MYLLLCIDTIKKDISENAFLNAETVLDSSDGIISFFIGGEESINVGQFVKTEKRPLTSLICFRHEYNLQSLICLILVKK